MPIPQLSPITKTEENLEKEPEKVSGRVIDISENFSDEALDAIKEAAKLAYLQKSRYITLNHLCDALSLKKNIGLIENETKEVFTGITLFSPEFKKILFGAYFLGKQEAGGKVENRHLQNSLALLPEMENLISEIPPLVSGKAINFQMPQTLKKFAKDLTGPSTSSDVSFFEREEELEHILRILSRENKHHIILIGEIGSGKSAISNGLAQLLVKKEIPSFQGSRILKLDLSSLFSSPQNFNNYGPKIIEETATLPKIIFFLDGVSLLAGSQPISLLSSFLQNLEKQAEVLFILPITPSFYNQFLSQNPYFSTLFETIKIEEMSPSLTEKILASQGPRMEKFHRVKIEEDVFAQTAILAKRYLSGTLPQKAISLLEEACASISLQKKINVTLDDIKNIVAQKTGIPIQSLTVSEKEKLNNLEIILSEFVIGQSEAIKKISQALRRARAGLKDPKKPIGSFLFLGPTGVGKTELAKTLAKTFFDDEKAFIRLDMSEYSESHTSQRLIGSPPGYVGYEEGGQLTNPIIERPYSLILLDEIEKAHPRIFDLFLQVLDDGRLTDSQGKTVDFKNTLLIFTSNIASEEIFANSENLAEESFDRKTFFENKIMPIIRGFFRPEFINRFDDIILFNPLTPKELVEIAKLKLKELNKRLLEKKIKVEISAEKLSQLVASSYNPSFGARPLERAIREQIENVIAQKIIGGEIKEGETIRW